MTQCWEMPRLHQRTELTFPSWSLLELRVDRWSRRQLPLTLPSCRATGLRERAADPPFAILLPSFAQQPPETSKPEHRIFSRLMAENGATVLCGKPYQPPGPRQPG